MESRNAAPPNLVDREQQATGLECDGAAEQLIERALDAIWLIDENDRILFVNPAACRLCGYSSDVLIGSRLSRILPPEVASSHGGFVKRYTENGGPTRVLGRVRELSIVNRDGTVVPVELEAFEITPSGGKRRFGAVMRDITRRKENQAEQRRLLETLARLATEDELTRLPNRRAFFEALRRALATRRRHGRPACVAIVDIDHFKRVNDNHGHDAGDRVLATVAKVMRGSLRTEDIIARIGGEEFAVLLPDTEIGGARQVLQRLCEIISETPVMITADAALHITVSAGVAAIGPYGDDHACLNAADAALLQAKASGRNQVVLAAEEHESG